MRAMNGVAALLALAGLGLWLPGEAAARDAGAAENAISAQAADSVSQKGSRLRPITRIRVHPLAQSYPGPDAVRQCKAWLAPEYRPSGTVIVPRMHCWWERG